MVSSICRNIIKLTVMATKQIVNDDDGDDDDSDDDDCLIMMVYNLHSHKEKDLFWKHCSSYYHQCLICVSVVYLQSIFNCFFGA